MLHGMLLTGRGRTGAKERESQNRKTTLGRTLVQPITRNIFQKSAHVFKKKKNDIKNLIGCSKIIWDFRCSCLGMAALSGILQLFLQL